MLGIAACLSRYYFVVSFLSLILQHSYCSSILPGSVLRNGATSLRSRSNSDSGQCATSPLVRSLAYFNSWNFYLTSSFYFYTYYYCSSISRRLAVFNMDSQTSQLSNLSHTGLIHHISFVGPFQASYYYALSVSWPHTALWCCFTFAAAFVTMWRSSDSCIFVLPTTSGIFCSFFAY